MVLFIDSYDSFSHILIDYLARLGQPCQWVQNNVSLADPMLHQPYTGVVLSPGPGTVQQSGNLLALTRHFMHRLPVLGVCLGHQALALAAGGQVRHAAKPMHGKTARLQTAPHAMWHKVPEPVEVVRYHSLLVPEPPTGFEATAWAGGELMAMAHRTLPVWGMQYHPEAQLTQGGLQMIANWLTHACGLEVQPVKPALANTPPMLAGPMW